MVHDAASEVTVDDATGDLCFARRNAIETITVHGQRDVRQERDHAVLEETR